MHHVHVEAVAHGGVVCIQRYGAAFTLDLDRHRSLPYSQLHVLGVRSIYGQIQVRHGYGVETFFGEGHAVPGSRQQIVE